MLLHQLLREFDPDLNLTELPNVAVRAVQEDSRRVQPGDLFVARSGLKTTGSQFVADAAARGAIAVASSSRLIDCPLPSFRVADAAAAASRLAHLNCGRPSRRLRVLGVTGTNGKTTSTYLLRHILNHCGIRCGMIGTVEIDDGNQTAEAAMTTPGPVDTAELLARMCDNACRACAMEVSSHALYQQRVADVAFAAAAFTNLTGDHLDYHGSMENYADAKAILFRNLSEHAVAIVNSDDAWSERMIEETPAKLIRFGFNSDDDYSARDVAVTAQMTRFMLHTPDGRAEVKLSLIGKHNVANALTAAALASETFGLSVHQLAAGLAAAAGAPGRLQPIRNGQPFAVLVDYAHTDDALENVLTALRPLTRGKLRVLFGCGGDRDRTKRPRMAKVAARLADNVYITSDNPRTENPQAIIDDICKGVPAGAGESVIVEPDRRSAIDRIISDAAAGDVVLLAGKGHENYQIIGVTKHHFDDVEEATRAIAHAVKR